MSGSPQQQPYERGTGVPAQQRSRTAYAASVDQLPTQRLPSLSEHEREQYERRLDEYEVLLAGYRARMAAYAAQLEAAHHDGLTGTWLRAAGQALLEKELQRAERAGTPLSVAFVDVDGLKARNDTAGHPAGDAALRTVARALTGGLRGYDHVIRWGGDEFLCVLPGATESEATARLEQARRLLAREPDALGISAGIVERRPAETADALVARADEELYGTRRRMRGADAQPAPMSVSCTSTHRCTS